MYVNEEEADVMPKPLEAIDWKRLSLQKKWLCKQAHNMRRHGNKQEYGWAVGLINLLDSIQEYAVEECGENPYTVYQQNPTT